MVVISKSLSEIPANTLFGGGVAAGETSVMVTCVLALGLTVVDTDVAVGAVELD